ncbi:MAG: hypothetical protein GXO14_02405 [Thermococci archaeon]|nr:hypothetical protein [Thermococci archaeon]
MPRYDVVIIPETIHKFQNHDMEHVFSPLVIGDRSEDIAIELAEGFERALMSRFQVEKEELQPDECDIKHVRYRVSDDGRSVIVHLHVRKAAEGCPRIEGIRCNVIEYERDIACLLDVIKECLSYCE